MSLKQVKTIGYDFFVDHLLWAFDLYGNNRNARLKAKRSYSSKQDVYVDELHQKLIRALGDQSCDVTILINGLLDFSEVAASFVLSKSVVTSLSKEQLYQRYSKHILCPLLAAYIEIFTEFHAESPIMRHLDTLLLSTQEEGVAHASRKMLLSILAAPECNLYREELIEFIHDIRPDRTQRRTTIKQKIQLAKTTCRYIENPKERQKYLLPLKELQEAYAACMAVIYFDIKTGLGCHLARLHKIASMERTGFPDVRVNTLSSSIIKFIDNHQSVGGKLTKEASEHLDKLWEKATRGVPQISNKYINQNLNTVFHLLGKSGYSAFRITNAKKSEKFFGCVTTQENMYFLKPYALTLQCLYHIKNNHLQAALDLLESSEACSLDNVIGTLPYYNAILFIGLTIKTASTKLKNGNLNPLVNIIINTQRLYEDVLIDFSGLSLMRFEAFTNDYSFAILRAIKEYNAISTRLSDINGNTDLSIQNAWDGVELLLGKINTKLAGKPTDDYATILAKAITKADKEEILITYLPNSTLYNCILELDCLSPYLELSTTNHPYTHRLLCDLEHRKELLKALEPQQFEKDTIPR